ncbi:MAG: FAD-binding oxidoreductase [Candidatus Saccharimonas sp.]
MSKVAAYLRGHISGEVVTRDDVREAHASDAGVLSIKPEMVIYPRTTNDIRKLARFTWQLAEKGHTVPITVQGAGTDTTGASIGKGMLVVTTAHMNKVYEYDTKQKLVRLQPGATVLALQSALSLHGTSLLALEGSRPYGTVGGAVANAVAGPLAGKYGNIGRTIQQLEVVLANGDVIQTSRINKRELSRRKGLQGLEGDIYRGIDGIIEEYAETIDKLETDDMAGYSSVADVKRKDGSFDLTPLFVGSQGTLGIMSEMILRADFKSTRMSVGVLVFADAAAARDALDDLAKMTPALLEYFDASIFEAARAAGHNYAAYNDAASDFEPQSVVVIGFDEFNDHKRKKDIKKLLKKFEKAEGLKIVTSDGETADDLLALLEVLQYTQYPDHNGELAPDIFGGFHVPTEQFEDFVTALKALGVKEHIDLPLTGHAITNTYAVYPTLSLAKVGDKQKLLKLLDALSKLVYSRGGTMVAEGGEGRLKARSVYAELDEETVAMYEAVRKVCDPFGTLNPGVKQVNDVRTLASELRDTANAGQFARFGS